MEEVADHGDPASGWRLEGGHAVQSCPRFSGHAQHENTVTKSDDQLQKVVDQSLLIDRWVQLVRRYGASGIIGIRGWFVAMKVGGRLGDVGLWSKGADIHTAYLHHRMSTDVTEV